MSDVKWIKFSTSMFDDEKVRLILSMPEGDAITIIWIRLLCLAGKTNDGGYIYLGQNMIYTDEMLASLFNYPLNTVRLALETFRRFGMIEMDQQRGIFVCNFAYHQDLAKLEVMREYERTRKQEQRAKAKSNSAFPLPSGDVPELSGTMPDCPGIEIDREIDIDSISSLRAREAGLENAPSSNVPPSYIPSDRFTNAVFQWAGMPLTPVMLEDVASLISLGRADEDLVFEAIEIAKARQNRSWDYVLGILRTNHDKGITTGAAYRQSRLLKDYAGSRKPNASQIEAAKARTEANVARILAEKKREAAKAAPVDMKEAFNAEGIA